MIMLPFFILLYFYTLLHIILSCELVFSKMFPTLFQPRAILHFIQSNCVVRLVTSQQSRIFFFSFCFAITSAETMETADDTLESREN